MLKALIVDEEVDNWFMLSSVLRQNLIKTNFVNNLSAARQSLQKEVPGVLFFDNHVQEGVAPNFIKYVKANYPEIKIVMVKDEDGLAVRRRMFSNEADLIISKPFDTEIINEAIKKIL
jgi:DNA-binding NtrC family response regulator